MEESDVASKLVSDRIEARRVLHQSFLEAVVQSGSRIVGFANGEARHVVTKDTTLCGRAGWSETTVYAPWCEQCALAAWNAAPTGYCDPYFIQDRINVGIQRGDDPRPKR